MVVVTVGPNVHMLLNSSPSNSYDSFDSHSST